VSVLKSRSFPGRKAWLYEYFADFPFRVPTTHAVRTERYIYIEFEGRRGRELYDIENDPNQLKDMIHTQEGQVMAGELKEILEDLRGNDVSSDPAREETTHHEIPMQ
jgi:hypothetical protein